MAKVGEKAIGVLAGQQDLAAVLSPVRRRLLQLLREPDSASGLARKLGLPRQKVNYHLRQLERAGLVHLEEELQRRGCVERRVRVTARAFVISPEFLEGLAADPDQIQDRFSSAYLVASAARVVRDVAALREGASRAKQRLATLGLDSEISFESAAAFNSFSKELAAEVARLVAKYNRSANPISRRFRLVVAAHPVRKVQAKPVRAETVNDAKR
jgi:DNA-binding transcriptional ArsR family regulator